MKAQLAAFFQLTFFLFSFNWHYTLLSQISLDKQPHLLTCAFISKYRILAGGGTGPKRIWILSANQLTNDFFQKKKDFHFDEIQFFHFSALGFVLKFYKPLQTHLYQLNLSTFFMLILILINPSIFCLSFQPLFFQICFQPILSFPSEKSNDTNVGTLDTVS